MVPIGETVSELDQKTWYVFQDQKGTYWFGTNRDGVIRYDGKILKRFTYKDGLVDNTIRGIQGDHLGNVYIETPMGVSKFDGKVFKTLDPIISPENRWDLTKTDLWFKCNGNPNDVYRYDGTGLYELKLPRKDLDKAFETKVQGLGFQGMNSSPYSVYGIDKDQAGNLWIGTIVAGAYRYDGKDFLWFPEKELSTLPDGRVPGVRSILEDKNGYFWLSNFISKFKINKNDETITYQKTTGFDLRKPPLDDQLPYFNSGLRDHDGTLWMTTYGGDVWKYDGEKLINFPVRSGTSEILLISIYQDHEGTIWLGTDNDGAYQFDGVSFEKFKPKK